MKIARALTTVSGFALVETMIAVGLLAIVASSTLYAMVSSNRFVVSQRYVSNAKALCQERIDDALMRPFTSTAIPEFFGTTWPLPTVETVTQQNQFRFTRPQART